MPDTPRVLVRKLRNNQVYGLTGDLWHWTCTACETDTDWGGWTSARHAHDYGRQHARHCAAFKLAKLLAEIDVQHRAAKLLADLDVRKGVRLSMWVFVADILNKLRTEATNA